jgi:hypothetical protein
MCGGRLRRFQGVTTILSIILILILIDAAPPISIPAAAPARIR